jgi:DNA-binding transcriptional LysR family regulator
LATGSRIQESRWDWPPPDPASAGAGNGQRWLGVEFRHLGALAAVAREGSFRRAAESLGYVQSAISSQIAHLERIVGMQLVERSSGTTGTTLTLAGRVLLGHVEDILARFEAAHIDVRALSDGTDVVIRLGVIDGVGPRRLPRILRIFSERFPESQVRIYESYSDEENFDRIARGELELMITELPLLGGPFDYTLLERDAYVLLVNSGSSLAKQGTPPDAEQLATQQILLPAAGRSEDSLLAGLRESGIQQPPWLRLRSIAGLHAAVAAGLGVAVVPALAVNPDDPNTVAIDVPRLLPERSLVLVRHQAREYSPSARGFIEIVNDTFNELRPHQSQN